MYSSPVLTSPHEWDPSVLDYPHPNICGSPSWAADSSARDQHDPRIDECGSIHSRAIHALSKFSDTHTTSIQKHDQLPKTQVKTLFWWGQC